MPHTFRGHGTKTDGINALPHTAGLIGLDEQRLSALWPDATRDERDGRCIWHGPRGSQRAADEPFPCRHSPTRLGARINEQSVVSEIVYEWSGVSWDALLDILHSFADSYHAASWDSESHSYRFVHGELVVRFESSLVVEALSYSVRVAYSSAA